METIVIEGNQCPKCGRLMPAGVLAGLCPACLLAQGADTQGDEAGARHFQPPPIAEIAKLFPQLEIIGVLGAGGMGAVYKARQAALDRFVALKILPATNTSGINFAERFNREARALARLSHPNIVAVHEFGQAGALHYFIMEFVDGTNLRQLEQAGRLSPREALQIVPQICDALQYAHDEGVVHRDIKPENVLVDRKGRVKIADFGLAKILGLDGQSARLTMEGQVMGTPHYMAPEQVERPLTVDHRADIYSLGVVFYEMLTGDLPLGKFSPPSRKVQMDVRLDEVVLRALENDPARRYQKASEVKSQVETITNTPGAAATGRNVAPRREVASRGRWWLALVLAVPLLVLFVPVAAWILYHRAGATSQLSQGTTTTPSFGPVIERSFSEAIDFETGVTTNYPVRSSPEPLTGGDMNRWPIVQDNLAWMQTNGFDAAAAPWGDLYCVFMEVVQIEKWGWDTISAAEVLKQVLENSQPGTTTTVPTRMLNPGSTVFGFRTRERNVGIFRVITHPEGGRPGVTLRYKLVQQPNKERDRPRSQSQAPATEFGRASSNYAASDRDAAAVYGGANSSHLGEPPQLRFLAWQDEWQRSQPIGAWRLDGSPVTNNWEIDLLHKLSPSSMDVSATEAEKRQPRFLHLWFSHPLINQNGLNETTLFDTNGTPIKLAGGGSTAARTLGASDHAEKMGWHLCTLSPGEGTNIPKKVTVRFRYAVGPFERNTQIVSSYQGSMSLEGNSHLNGIGQDVEGNAFVAIAVDALKTASRHFGVNAITRDGRELASTGNSTSGHVGSALRVEKFSFNTPLKEIAHFRIGTRQIRTAEWKNVVLRE
jgi:hypothetical protein